MSIRRSSADGEELFGLGVESRVSFLKALEALEGR